jgi:hypothetical protein
MDLRRLQDAMNRLDVYAIAECLGIEIIRDSGIGSKPLCPICDKAIPQPHAHCDYCESPYVLGCTAPRCRAMCCASCMPEHSRGHAYE